MFVDTADVLAVITGASTAKQARENAAVSNSPPLSGETHARLAEFYRDSVREHIRGVY